MKSRLPVRLILGLMLMLSASVAVCDVVYGQVYDAVNDVLYPKFEIPSGYTVRGIGEALGYINPNDSITSSHCHVLSGPNFDCGGGWANCECAVVIVKG
jgi:hypothetical protein